MGRRIRVASAAISVPYCVGKGIIRRWLALGA